MFKEHWKIWGNAVIIPRKNKIDEDIYDLWKVFHIALVIHIFMLLGTRCWVRLLLFKNDIYRITRNLQQHFQKAVSNPKRECSQIYMHKPQLVHLPWKRIFRVYSMPLQLLFGNMYDYDIDSQQDIQNLHFNVMSRIK